MTTIATTFDDYGKPWSYRDHICIIDRVLDDNLTDYFAEVRTPSGELRCCGLGRTDSSNPAMIELWIDAGMPRRPWGQLAPFTKSDLLQMKEQSK